MKIKLILCAFLFSCTSNEGTHTANPLTFLSPIAEGISNKSFDPSSLMWYTKEAAEWVKLRNYFGIN